VRLRIDFAVTVPKDIERQALNEDAWAADQSVTRVAVSDGASESFDSRALATLLVNAYIADPSFSAEWLAKVLATYLVTVDYESLSWSKQAAFDRGSFATLLALEVAPNGDIEVLALGDSVAFHLRGNELLTSFPYTSAEEFDARPQLLSTITASNAFITEPGFFGRNTCRTWHVQAGDIILLATDAVSQWALHERGPDQVALSYLRAVNSPENFESQVLELRRQSRIRVDDSTMIRLVVEG
jgi:hypothetical protein